MFGDICPSCQLDAIYCNCDSVTVSAPCRDPEPCFPCESGDCSTWISTDCVFWMGDPIPGTPIIKGTKLSEVVIYLLSRINTLL